MNFLLLFVFGFSIIAFELYRFYRFPSFRFDFQFFFSFWFFKAFVLAPLAILIIGPQAMNPVIERFYDAQIFALALVSAFVVWVCFVFGYSIVPPQKSAIYCSLRVYSPVFFWGVLAFFGFAGISFFIYRLGLSTVISQNIRYGGVEGDHLGVFGLYARAFLWMMFFSMVGSYTAKRSYSRDVVAPNFLVLLFVFFIVLVVTVQGASRAAYILVFVLPYLVCCFVLGRLFKPVLMLVGVAIAVFMLLFGRSVMGHMLFSDVGGIFEAVKTSLLDMGVVGAVSSLSQSYSHPFLSVFVAFSGDGNFFSPRLFWDVPLGVLFYLKLFGFDTDLSITYYHSFLLTGEYNSDVPPGLVASLYYQAYGIGLVVGALILGLLFGLLNAYLRRLAVIDWVGGIYIYAGFTLGNFVMVGDPRVYAIRVFFILLVIVLVRMFFVKKLGSK
ncbi:MAG: hypothetical protein R3F47_16245 [Gammaproteobacteria bacterium]